MNQRPDPSFRPADDGELLSAYLDGDVTPEEAAALEARLEREPDLAERLERMRAAVERLATARVRPPDGFSERLRTRLTAEAGVDGQAGVATADDHAVPEALESEADRRVVPLRTRRPRWQVPASAAAAVLLVAVVGATVVSGLRDGDERLGAADTAQEEAVEDSAGAELFAEEGGDAAAPRDDGGDMADGDDMADGAEAPEADADDSGAVTMGLPPGPVVLDAGTRLADADAARDHLLAVAPFQVFLGTPPEEAAEAAAAFGLEFERLPAFSSGVEPARCLDVVASSTEHVAVPLFAEWITYADEEAIAYVAATSSADATPLDRALAWVVEPSSCATRLFTDLSGG